MFDALSEAEIALLKLLAERGTPQADTRLDPAALRDLGLRRYVRRLSGFSVITPEGRAALQALTRGEEPEPAPRPSRPMPYAQAAPVEEPEAGDDDVRVNSTQEDMIRQLVQSESPVPFDDLDGRVVRALEGRGLVRRADGLVELTDAGRDFYEKKVRRRRRARSGWVRSAAVRTEEAADDRVVRAQSIREAVDALRRAIGGAEELEVGDLPASADQAFTALLELADRIERGADPRRISQR